MMSPLQELTAADMRALADALRAGRISPPFSALGAQRYCGGTDAAEVAAGLQEMAALGATPQAIAFSLELIADERGRGAGVDDTVDLVWTGPEAPEAPSRDTAVVVRELFMKAKESVLVAGYAIYQGKEVFKALADRMEELPDLKVEMFLDIQRGQGDTTIDSDLVRRFAQKFRTKDWPGKRLPEIYYDPRSLEMDRAKKTALHAKCVVIDRAVAFVSSANFTEAAQNRNIEVGALIASPRFAERLVHQFHALAGANVLREIHY